jgi:hypothetical protein
MNKKISLVALILSIICLIGNLALMVYDIGHDLPYWKDLISALLMVVIAYSAYTNYKKNK